MHSQLEARETQANGRTIYESIVATVRGVSQYNTFTFSLEGIDGWWQRKEDLEQPVVGQSYRFLLGTKPKINDPSKDYCDILRMESTDDTPTAVGPRSAPASTQSNGSAPAVVSQGGGRYDDRNVAITTAVISNNLATLALAAATLATAKPKTAEEKEHCANARVTFDAALLAVEAVRAGLPEEPAEEPAATEPPAEAVAESPADEGPPPAVHEEPEAETELPW